MKKILFLIIVLYSVFLSSLCANDNKKEIPVKPRNIPLNAVWDANLEIWSSGSFEDNIVLWRKNGVILANEILIKKNIKKIIQYHNNGKIHRMGYLRYFKDKYNNDGDPLGWITIGKWRKYDTNGYLMHEKCETAPLADYGEESLTCGVEIFYNKDGSIKKKIIHEYKCEYGCDEPE